jgi:L-ascorbate metabolism protein UlaG (beta-lactamase superfamily)
VIRVGDDPEPLRLRWLGHSGFLVEWHGTRLLLDPNLSLRCTVAPRLLELPIPPGDLGPVDAALVSHAHRDHLDLPTLEALAGHKNLPLLALPAGAEGYAASLRGLGVEVVGVPFGEALALGTVGALEAIPVPALHGGSRSHPLASRRSSAGWVIRARTGSGSSAALYFAGDTGYSRPLFRSIGERYRPAVAILPIGAYSPAFPIGRVHLSPERAARAALDLADLAHGGRPPVVVPCHFGTFRLSLDRPDAALPRFARAARRAGLDWRMPALLGADAESAEARP